MGLTGTNPRGGYYHVDRPGEARGFHGLVQVPVPVGTDGQRDTPGSQIAQHVGDFFVRVDAMVCADITYAIDERILSRARDAAFAEHRPDARWLPGNVMITGERALVLRGPVGTV